MALNIVIIGANKGIGLALTHRYVAAGHKVIAVCRQASTALKSLSCNIVEGVDVTDSDSVMSLNSAIDLKQIDILIHNAGILESDYYPDIDFKQMKRHFDVNALGALRTVMALESKLKSGSKVGILSSRVGSIDDNSSSNNYAYRVSKTAVNMIGKCLSLDLKSKGVALVLLHPGYVKTDMTQGNGFVDTNESAEGLTKRIEELSLASTGQFVHASGELLPW